MSAREDLAAVLRLKGLTPREVDALLDAHRAETLHEAADHLADALATNPACRAELHPGVQAAIDELRRMADEAPGRAVRTTATGVPCPDHAAAPAGAEDGDQ